MTRFLSLALVAGLAAQANAQITVDGVLDAAYGAPLAVQTVQTEFGDEDGVGEPSGGELDAAYAAIDGDNLAVFIAGNLETDSFNKLNLFIDSKAGGENVLAALNYDFGDVAANLGGVTLAPGFAADFHLYARAGFGNFEVDFVDRQAGGPSVLANTGSAALSGDFGSGAGVTVDNATQTPNGSAVTGDALVEQVAFALDNSNTAGVAGGNGAADQVAAAAVTTGAEFLIPLAELEVAFGDTISIVAAYGNGDQNFFSNQFLGGLPAGTSNLGGNQDFSGAAPFSITVIPEPASALLLGLAAIGLAARRR